MSERENLPGSQTPQAQPERLSDILPSLVPLAKEYLANQARDAALRERELDHDARLDEKEIVIDAQQWRWQVTFVAGLCLAFLSIAAASSSTCARSTRACWSSRTSSRWRPA